MKSRTKIVVDRLLEDGVNFYCTDGIVISPDVTIGRDTTIAPGTQLIGHVEIGEDCVIGPNTIIENSQIGNGCQIHSSFIEKSKVGTVFESDLTAICVRTAFWQIRSRSETLWKLKTLHWEKRPV